MIIICSIAIITVLSAAKNEFIPGLKVSLSNDKFKEARDVYFNYILD